jgi:hypothetical protein
MNIEFFFKLHSSLRLFFKSASELHSSLRLFFKSASKSSIVFQVCGWILSWILSFFQIVFKSAIRGRRAVIRVFWKKSNFVNLVSSLLYGPLFMFRETTRKFLWNLILYTSFHRYCDYGPLFMFRETTRKFLYPYSPEEANANLKHESPWFLYPYSPEEANANLKHESPWWVFYSRQVLHSDQMLSLQRGRGLEKYSIAIKCYTRSSIA